MFLWFRCFFLCGSIGTAWNLQTYVLKPQVLAETKVTTDIRLPYNLYNYTMCLRVKPRLTAYRRNTCNQVAFAFHQYSGEEVFVVTSDVDRRDPQKTLLSLRTSRCASKDSSYPAPIRQTTSQVACDGIWRTICVSALENGFISLISRREDTISSSETNKVPCSHTPILTNGGSFVFNTVSDSSTDSAKMLSDSKIKDIILWNTPLTSSDYRNIAVGDQNLLPREDNIIWVFNSKSTFTQTGPISVEEYQYGKGLFASPSYLLLGKNERAVLSCAVFLNDYYNRSRYMVQWVSESTNEGGTEPLPFHKEMTSSEGDVFLYTLQVNSSQEFSKGNYYCTRDKIRV